VTSVSQIIGVLSVHGNSGLRTLCEIRENSWSSASEKNTDVWKVIRTVAVMITSHCRIISHTQPNRWKII